MNLNHENKTEIYIRKCKKFIEAEKNETTKNENTRKINNDNNVKSNANTNTNNVNTNTGLSEEDKECIKITKEKDYYKILNLTTSADETEIKKSYKKVNKET